MEGHGSASEDNREDIPLPHALIAPQPPNPKEKENCKGKPRGPGRSAVYGAREDASKRRLLCTHAGSPPPHASEDDSWLLVGDLSSQTSTPSSRLAWKGQRDGARAGGGALKIGGGRPKRAASSKPVDYVRLNEGNGSEVGDSDEGTGGSESRNRVRSHAHRGTDEEMYAGKGK